MAEVSLKIARHNPFWASIIDMETTRYDQSRVLCLDLVTRARYASNVLRDLEHRAPRSGFTYAKLEELTANRHKYYGPDHPWTWIRPYLDPAKLHVYLDCYPGLTEMKAGLYLQH